MVDMERESIIRLDEKALGKVLEKEFGIPLKAAISAKPVDENQLTPGERIQFQALTAARRRDSWLKGRSALKRLLPYFGESKETSDLSFPNPRFSLTHSGGYAVALGTASSQLLGIGIDLELRRPPRSESARFFLNREEHRWVMHLEESLRPPNLLRLWTIKEALFKSDPNNHSTDLIDYFLEDPGRQTGRAFVKHQGGRSEIRYLCCYLEEGFLSVAILPKKVLPDRADEFLP